MSERWWLWTALVLSVLLLSVIFRAGVGSGEPRPPIRATRPPRIPANGTRRLALNPHSWARRREFVWLVLAFWTVWAFAACLATG